MKTQEEKAFEEIRVAVESEVTDREFWHSRAPQERIWAIELMRRRAYGYDEHSVPKLKRVIEFDKLRPQSDEATNSSGPSMEQS